MPSLPANEASLLKPDGFMHSYPRLSSEVAVDTVIVGGGISGLSTAYLLKRAGQKVAVVEKDAIGSGTTGHTTGKVTSQHNLMYAGMLARLGTRITRAYGRANQAAIAQIEKVIKAEKIDCGWARTDNYVYTTEPSRVSDFRKEAKVAAGLGLPASFETISPLPFSIRAAVRFADQAHFSAQKYIEGLAKAVHGNGSFIYEKSRALSFIDGAPSVVKTSGGKVVADNIVVATNVPTFPLLARGSYCFMEYPHNSYLVAGRPKYKLEGMYISPDRGHYSLLPVGSGKNQILLVGGENHIPGLGRAEPRQQKLADYAQRHFGVGKIDYRWHARDYIAYDGLPLVGDLYPWSKHIFVISAFKKWGLSQSMVAANLMRDLLAGQPNELAEIYTPHRLSTFASIPHTIVAAFK